MTVQTDILRINRFLNQLAQTHEFSSSKYEVLKLIKNQNPITLRKLCDIQQVSMPTMSNLVDVLQNDSLIIRAISKEDARQRWIVPTQKGISVLNKIEQEGALFWQKKLEKLTESEQKHLSESLSLLAAILE